MSKSKNEYEAISLSYGEVNEVLQGIGLISGLFLPDIEVNCDLGLIRKRLTEFEEVGIEAKKNLFNKLAVEKMVPVEDEAVAKKGKKEKKKVIPAGAKSEAYQKALTNFSKKRVDVEIPILKIDSFKPDEEEEEDPRKKIPNGFFQLVWPILDKAQNLEISEAIEVPEIEITLEDIEGDHKAISEKS